MYSEHLVASLRERVQGSYLSGADLDQARGRIALTLGRVIGPSLGYNANDAALRWAATTSGTPAPLGTRAALHVLADGRTALGLGRGRGVIESAGDRLVIVTDPEAHRYEGAWWLPTINYGGLL